MINLTNTTYSSSAKSIYINGQDIYIAGTESNASGKRVATYWKNGTQYSLTDGTKKIQMQLQYLFMVIISI